MGQWSGLMDNECFYALSTDHKKVDPMVFAMWKDGKESHRGYLCQACFVKFSAWKLHDPGASYEEEEPAESYHGEDEVEDDTPQPNNNLRGNPYR
jgi:hypothetical protein